MDGARQHPAFDITRSWKLPDVPALPGDEALDSYLRRIGFSDEQLDYVRRSFANAVGDSMPYISASAILAELRDTSNGEGDFRLLDGYDSLTDDLADSLSICLDTVVERVQWSGAGVRVETAGGQVFEADQVIITLPLGVLQSGSFIFDPPLPAEKQAAIDALRMGAALKLVYVFSKPLVPPGVMAVYSALNPPMWWSPSFGQATDQQVWTAFVTGDGARDLLALGEAGALEAGLSVLRTELGRPPLQPTNACLVNWPADPFARGGYSVVPPGQVGARAALAQPIADRLYWAGEATAPGAGAATVHGAYASGRRAANEILAKQRL